MEVHPAMYDAIFGSDPLGRFTAAVVTTVPEFDPGETPIGHALAAEFFRGPDPEARTPELPALAPERVYDWPAEDEPPARPSPRPRAAAGPPAVEIDAEDEEVAGMLLELPVAGSSLDWFAVTEHDEQARRAG
ncbi:MAG: hypothetical protein L0H84_09275 [Pseudonocardia sp.]|nr:hypothetical protein [Pseudonocardia sp.]